MKLTNIKKNQFFKNPTTPFSFALVYGSNSLEVNKNCKVLTSSLAGPEAEKEMRIEEYSNDFIQKNPTALENSCKSIGFFSGPRIVIIRNSTDVLTKQISYCIDNWIEGDAIIIGTSGNLPQKSSLRKLAENSPISISLPIYDNPLTDTEIKTILNEKEIVLENNNLFFQLKQYQQTMDTSIFQNSLETLSLYKYKDRTPATLYQLKQIFDHHEQIVESDTINFMIDGNVKKLIFSFRKLHEKKVNPTSLIIIATRYFLNLHKIAASANGIDDGLKNIYPPLYGEQKLRLINQLKIWNIKNIELVLDTLASLDAKARSSSPIPIMAVLEREFLKISKLSQKTI